MKLKRVLVSLVAVAMTVSLVPAMAFATEVENDDETAIIEVADAKAENPAKLGTPSAQKDCGKNLCWSISGGTLIISGSGAMYNYSYKAGKRAPWYESRSSITAIQFTGKPTSIGSYAFYCLTGIGAVSIPSSVTSIGTGAFSYSSVSKISGGSKVKTIGARAFKQTKKLTSFSISSKSLYKIGSYAFQSSAVKTISISKTTKLKKKNVRKSLKSSKVKKVNVKNSKKVIYRFYFSKTNAGRKVKVY